MNLVFNRYHPFSAISVALLFFSRDAWNTCCHGSQRCLSLNCYGPSLAHQITPSLQYSLSPHFDWQARRIRQPARVTRPSDFFFCPSYDSWGFPQKALGAYPRAHPSVSNTSTIPGCHRRSPVFDGSISCSRCPCILFPWRCFTTLTACACKGNRDEQASWWYANQTRLTYSTLLMHV
jgi:hypothetical protein